MPFAELNLNILLSEVRDVGFRIRPEAKRIGEVELQFGAGIVRRWKLCRRSSPADSRSAADQSPESPRCVETSP